MHSRTFIRPVFAPCAERRTPCPSSGSSFPIILPISRLFAVRAALHRHHAVHLHLRHRGRPVCLQLCGQDGLCGGQPHHAAAHAAGHHRLYAGHRRQRHRGHHAGRGRPEKGRPLFHPVPAGGSGLGQCAGRAGHCVPAAHCRAAWAQRGSFWTMRCAMDAS